MKRTLREFWNVEESASKKDCIDGEEKTSYYSIFLKLKYAYYYNKLDEQPEQVVNTSSSTSTSGTVTTITTTLVTSSSTVQLLHPIVSKLD